MRILVLLTFLALLPAAQAQVTLANANSSFTFATAPFGLQGMTNLAAGQSFPATPGGFWNLTFRSAGGQKLSFQPEDFATGPAVLTTTTAQVKTLTATWTGLAINATNTFTVVATVSLPEGSPTAAFTISVATATPDFSLFSVEYPVVTFQPLGNPQDEFLVVPWRAGWLVHDPRTWGPTKNGQFGVHPSFYSLQVLGYYDRTDLAQVYFATQDPLGRVKELSFTGSPAPRFSVRQYPENNVVLNIDYASPYPVVVGPLRGDWVDTAARYRAWALPQPFLSRGRLETAATPLNGVDFHGLFSGADFNASHRELQDWKDFLSSCDGLTTCNASLSFDRAMALIYGWHDNGPGLDAGWPDYKPFKPTVQEMLDQPSTDVFSPYYHPAWYSLTSPQYLADSAAILATIARVNESGEVIIVPNQDDPAQPNLLADQSSSAWRVALTGIVADLAASGWDGVYWDTWDTLATLEYSGHDGHPKGGGSFYVQGMQDLAEASREAGGPDFFLTSEMPQELFISQLDLEYHNPGTEAVGNIYFIPLFHTVYHDYIPSTTIVATQPQLPDSLVDLATYQWAVYAEYGFLPGVTNSQVDVAPTFPISSGGAFYTYLKKLFRAIEYHRAFARYGQKLRSLPLVVAAVPPATIGPLANQFATDYFPDVPTVFSPVWKSGKGAVAIELINWHSAGQPVDYTFDLAAYGLDGGTYGLYASTELGLTLLATSSTSFTRSLTVPSRDVIVHQVIKLPTVAAFAGTTTAFATVPDITAVQDAVLEKAGQGKIAFAGLLDFSGLNVDGNVTIATGLVTIPDVLDRPATVTLANLSLASPTVFRNGAPCATCAVLSTTGDIVSFSVPGPGTYTVTGVCTDADSDGYNSTAGSCGLLADCNDANPAISPAAVEACGNGLDDDCDLSADEGCTCTPGATQACGAPALGICAPGTQACGTAGVWDACIGAVGPQPEVCGDGIDQDCTGADLPCPDLCDADGDGSCPPADCNDADPGVYPGALEMCADGVDQDCTGTDPCCEGATQACGSAIGACEPGLRTCTGGIWRDCFGNRGPEPESCNAEDDDCDAETDEQCEIVEEACSNGIQDLGEQGVDCGGACAACAFSLWTVLLAVGVVLVAGASMLLWSRLT